MKNKLKLLIKQFTFYKQEENCRSLQEFSSVYSGAWYQPPSVYLYLPEFGFILSALLVSMFFYRYKEKSHEQHAK